MSRIRHLSDPLISQIAAGEVVERPSSVVKELIENSLDAGATTVRVELESGGKGRILVADDGCGMDRDDALLAFDRHATSKIASFADLERVATLGFRGEALASIAAVARIELTTAETPGDGHRVRLEGGVVRIAEPAARARGTTIEITSLFFNVPARRKFLKAPATELRRALEVVQGYALARPDVRFTVLHEGRTLLDALPSSDGEVGLAQRIGQLFGRELERSLSGLAPSAGEGPERGPSRDGEHIVGFVGAPESARHRRFFTFVNQRLVRDRALMATFYKAVREEWRSEDFPALFLFLELPPEEVDVNVHPQKAEVRFRDPSLLERVLLALRSALSGARGEVPAPLRQPLAPPRDPFAWQGLGERSRERYDAPASGWELREASASAAAPPWESQRAAETAGSEQVSAAVPQQRIALPTFEIVDRPRVPLSGRSGEARPFRVLGQYKGTLILLEGPDGLYLIDQHVAHERLLYERLRRSLEREVAASQTLLTPLLLDLAPAEVLRLAELAPRLESLGFGVAELSGGSLGVTAIPSVLSAEEAERLLLQLATEQIEAGDDPAALRRALLESLAASLSCKAAVKMHHPLRALEMEALVAELFQAEQPYACPHGRPIVLQLTDADLERRFGRR